jgi:hypothetical protein
MVAAMVVLRLLLREVALAAAVLALTATQAYPVLLPVVEAAVLTSTT